MAPYDRNNVSLNIANSNGAEYYDQICAISQETINKNFEVLFNQRPELVELWYEDRLGNGGVLDVILDPPRVKLQISASDAPEMYFEIRFKSGQIKLSSDLIVNVGGWSITVQSKLGESQISHNPKIDQDAQNEAIAAMEEIKKSYDVARMDAAIKKAQEDALKAAPAATNAAGAKVATGVQPGDYSIQRLFCVIAQGNWQAPEEAHSFLPDPKDKTKKISIAQWRASNLDPETRQVATEVSKLLGNWAAANQESAFWNLGIQVRLPVEKVAKENWLATCAPTATRLQNYAYVSDADQLAMLKSGTKMPLASQVEIGNPRNCLVFCETVRRELPGGGSRLNYGGNLADSTTPGTFALDHRLYLEQKIIKHLKPLCVATSVIPLYPNMFVDQGSGEQQFQSKYVVGGNPPRPEDYPGLPDQNPSSSSFDLKWEKNCKYSWRRTYSAPGSRADVKTYQNCNSAPVYRKWDITAENAVEVTWDAGSDNILIAGSVRYNHWEAYNKFGNPNFGWGSSTGCYYGEFWINVDWSFNIDLCDKEMTFEEKKAAIKEEARLRKEEAEKRAKGLIPQDQPSTIKAVPNGVINPVINGLAEGNSMPLKLTITGGGGAFVLDNTDGLMRTAITDSIKTRIPQVCANIKESLKDSGKFTYPGTRTLVFGDPKLNNFGDIIATVDYLDLDDGLVSVNAPIPKPISGGTSQPAKPVVTDSTVTGNPTHVTWNPKITYDEAKGRAVLVLEGRNNSPDEMAFEGIGIQLLPTAGKQPLFSAGQFGWTSKKAREEKERISRQTNEAEAREREASGQPVNGPAANGTAANGSTTNGSATNGSATNGSATNESATNGSVTNGSATNGSATNGSVTNGSATNGSAANSSAANGQAAPATSDASTPLVTRPETTSVWDFTQKSIKETLRVTLAQQKASLIFNIDPEPLSSKISKKLPRFTMMKGGYFNLTLEGPVSPPGDYIIQLNETWNLPDYTQDMKGKRSASTFLKCQLISGTDGIVFVTSQADADKTRGVAASS